MFKPRRFLVSTCTLFLVMANSLLAHPESASYSDISIQGQTFHYLLRIPLAELDLILELDSDLDGIVTLEEIARQESKIKDYVQDRVRILVEEEPLEMEARSFQLWIDQDEEQYLEMLLLFTANAHIQDYSIHFQIFRDIFPAHYSLASITYGDVLEQAVIRLDAPHQGRLQQAQGVWATVWQFTVLGIEHIFLGYDHILFLIGLLLVATGLIPVIKIVTSFTIAHSITLALAGLDLVNPPGWLVESGIALSIAYVGFENLVLDEFDKRWRITFLFGLIHGFGFAGVLKALDLTTARLVSSLFSFNLGVEIGQVVIVALLYPLLAQLARLKQHHRLVQLGSSLVIGLGLFWFYQRAF